MSQVLENLKTRRSIKKYKADMVEKEKIDAIIEAGLYAANGKAGQSAIIVAITDKKIRDELSRDNCKIGGWAADFDPFYGAPVVLLVLADKNWPTFVQDGSLVLGNMMTAAHDLGLGSCWINRAKEEFEQEKWQKWLKDEVGVAGEYAGVGHLVIGYADGDAPKAAPRKENRVYYV